MKFTLINEHGAINRYDEAVGELLCEGRKPVFIKNLSMRLKEDRTAIGFGDVQFSDVQFSSKWIEDFTTELTPGDYDPRVDLRITISEEGKFVRWLYPGVIFLHSDSDFKQSDIVVDIAFEFVCRWEPAHVVSLNPA